MNALVSSSSIYTKSGGTHIPSLQPMCQIVVIDPPLQRHMLSHPDHHIVRGSHIDHWRLARIGRRDPYCDWKFVLRAAKGDGQRPRKEEKQRGETGFVGFEHQDQVSSCSIPVQFEKLGLTVDIGSW